MPHIGVNNAGEIEGSGESNGRPARLLTVQIFLSLTSFVEERGALVFQILRPLAYVTLRDILINKRMIERIKKQTNTEIA